MLIRNCETKLIFPGDFNVRVTVCKESHPLGQKEGSYPSWLDTIKESLGGSILNSDEIKTFSIRRIDKKQSYLFKKRSSGIMSCFTYWFQKPVSFRLETIEEHPKVWIFYLEKDLK